MNYEQRVLFGFYKSVVGQAVRDKGTFDPHCASSMSHLSRGMPRVTFASPRPAMWNVFSVICVLGSPTDWAASTPTASPGAASDLPGRSWKAQGHDILAARMTQQGALMCLRQA